MPEYVFGIASPDGVLAVACLDLAYVVFGYEAFEAPAPSYPLGCFVLGECLYLDACELVEVGKEDSFGCTGVEADCVHSCWVLVDGTFYYYLLAAEPEGFFADLPVEGVAWCSAVPECPAHGFVAYLEVVADLFL